MYPESASERLDTDLRFDEAPTDAPAAPTCARCGQAIESEYFEVAGAIVCQACSAALASEIDEGSPGGRFTRALVYGFGGAAAGAALYYGIVALTGYEIGLVAIAVGWLVGRAVQLGSRHRGGRVYQILAVGLTYVAIVSTYIPYILDAFGGSPDVGLGPLEGAVILLTALAAPFLAGLKNIIGLLIIGFALWQAWQMNARRPLVISGPYAVGGARAGAPQGS